MRIGKGESAKFTILVRNNTTNKHRSMVFDGEVENEEELLNLIKSLLVNFYEKGSKK
jgi:hypothetical protein